MKWQDIASAPLDGTVVLTDCGTGCYVDRRNWGSPVIEGWYLCDIDAHIPRCADEGMSVSAIEPNRWMDIPKDA